MNQLNIISVNGQLVTDSREVAEMTEKNHSHLMRDIKGYIEILTQSNFGFSDFFIESSYKDSTGRKLPRYLITKKGCDMVANKMTGEKGVLFTAEYVTRFQEMEQTKRPSNQIEILQGAVNELANQGERITNLEENMRIDGIQERKLQNKGAQIVIESLGGKGSPAYKKVSKKAFSEIWRDFKNHFMIPRYSELPRVQFNDGLRFIDMWQPSTSLRIEIEKHNNQQTIDEVI